ncbi:uncharacterized protein PpBr36_06789 [Pyricularia pennisetigena]|uniref:uncharacterized protein n=1 Tax=Pyricularia pennisetigena TaxID=1578925 RepID=UPI00114F0C1A|nr:uncharacterized protein PpBr36_06789 [Pyricularia pennisetigena]TLS22585.1 hypothetical protein PpBr36_06789 [Pyricularia pennisetigena]
MPARSVLPASVLALVVHPEMSSGFSHPFLTRQRVQKSDLWVSGDDTSLTNFGGTNVEHFGSWQYTFLEVSSSISLALNRPTRSGTPSAVLVGAGTARHIDKVKLVAATGAIPPWAPLNNAASAPQGRFRLRELMVLVLVIFHWLFPVGDVEELQLVDELVVELSIPLCLLWVEAPDCVSIFGHGLSNTFAHGSIGRKNCLCCEFLSEELRGDGNIRGPVVFPALALYSGL